VRDKNKSRNNFTILHGFYLAIVFLLVGLLLDAFVRIPIASIIPIFPGNLILLICTLLILVIGGIIFRKTSVFRFLSSVKAAVPAICFFSLMILLIGIFPQEFNDSKDKIPWLYNIKNTWTFYLSGLLLVIILMAITAKRMKVFNLRNIVFILNHLGITIILLGAGFGQSDYQELRITLMQNEPIWYAYNNANEIVELNFALEMQSFELEYHLPLIKIEIDKQKRFKLFEVDTANLPYNINYGNYTITFKEVCLECVKKDNSFINFEFPGAVSATKIFLEDVESKTDTSFWISTGSKMFLPDVYNYKGVQISIMPPSAKRYTTRARYYPKNGINSDLIVRVNKPAKLGKYMVYQQSYDIDKGKYSDISVLNIVKDPWLPVVYFGIFMLLAGIVLLFVTGKHFNSSKQ
jgi:hypothetical protein